MGDPPEADKRSCGPESFRGKKPDPPSENSACGSPGGSPSKWDGQHGDPSTLLRASSDAKKGKLRNEPKFDQAGVEKLAKQSQKRSQIKGFGGGPEGEY
jgi:hypothetical protein